jgi:hypothetical protein
LATAFLVYGYIGSGKTTVARQIAEDQNAIRFSSDEWVAGLFGSFEGAVPDFDAALERVESMLQTVWTRCLTLGTDVVLDFGFWARSQRDQVRARVADLGAVSRLVEVPCEPDIAWARVKRRNKDLRGSVEISQLTFELLRAKFEPLAHDEPHRSIDTSEH